MSTPAFDLTFTIIVGSIVRKLFPDGSLDLLFCHDDTTAIAPTVLPPSDDPTLTRLNTASLSTISSAIAAFAKSKLTAVEIATYYHVTPRAERVPDPVLDHMASFAIPHFPLIISVLGEILQTRLGLKLAPGHKMRFYQQPQPANSRIAIRTNGLWVALLPKGVSYTDTTYRVAGAAAEMWVPTTSCQRSC